MNQNQQHLKKYIAIGAALLIFIPFIFGGQLFPRIFPFSVLQAGVFGGNVGDTSDTPPENDIGADVGGFSDPVIILDLEIGEGTLAESSKTVSVGYIGTRIDPVSSEEIVFDQNLDGGSPFSFILGSGMVIPGFDQGVTGMRVGGKRLIIIQPEMGYGDQQVGDIPPNTTLQFMVELYEVK